MAAHASPRATGNRRGALALFLAPLLLLLALLVPTGSAGAADGGPTPAASAIPTGEQTPTPTSTATPTATPTVETTPTPAAEPAPTTQPTPSPTAETTATPTPTAEPTPTPSPTPSPTEGAQAAVGSAVLQGTIKGATEVVREGMVRAYPADDPTAYPIDRRFAVTDGSDPTWSLDVPSGRYVVQFSGPGFETQWYVDGTDRASATVVDVSADGAVAQVDVTVTNTASISGRATNADGSAFRGGIKLKQRRNGAPDIAVSSAAQLIDGHYVLEVPEDGDYRIEFQYAQDIVHYPGPTSEGLTGVIHVTGSRSNVDVVFDPAGIAGSVSGKVTQIEGADIHPGGDSMALVPVDNSTGNYVFGQVNADGTYEFPSAPPGAYEVRFRSNLGTGANYGQDADTDTRARTVVVAPRERVTGIDIVMPKYVNLKVRLAHPEGDNRVLYSQAWRQLADGTWRQLGDNGEWTIDAVSFYATAGKLRFGVNDGGVTLYYDGHGLSEIPFDQAATIDASDPVTLDLTLSDIHDGPWSRVWGQITDDAGKPVTVGSVRYSAYLKAPFGWGFWYPIATVRLNNMGYYQFDVHHGVYRAHLDAYVDGKAWVRSYIGGSESEPFDIDVTNGGTHIDQQVSAPW